MKAFLAVTPSKAQQSGIIRCCLRLCPRRTLSLHRQRWGAEMLTVVAQCVIQPVSLKLLFVCLAFALVSFVNLWSSNLTSRRRSVRNCGVVRRCDTYTSFVSVNRVLHDDFGDTPVEVLPPSRFASERKLCIERFACDAEAYNGSFEVCRNLIHRLVTLEVGHRTTITGK